MDSGAARFEKSVDSIVGAGQLSECVPDAVSIGEVLTFSERAFIVIVVRDGSRTLLGNHESSRMGEGHDKGSVGAEQAMCLAKDAPDVGYRGEGMDVDDCVEDVGVQERKIGEVAVVDLDVDFGVFGRSAGELYLSFIGVDRDDLGALGCEGNG